MEEMQIFLHYFSTLENWFLYALWPCFSHKIKFNFHMFMHKILTWMVYFFMLIVSTPGETIHTSEGLHSA